jgi:hypothetical protein
MPGIHGALTIVISYAWVSSVAGVSAVVRDANLRDRQQNGDSPEQGLTSAIRRERPRMIPPGQSQTGELSRIITSGYRRKT